MKAGLQLNVKEKPFLDSMENLGPIPRFIVANSFAAGFFAMIIGAALGALALLFIGGFFSPGLERQTFDVIRVGAIAGVAIGALALFFLGVSALFQRAEAGPRASYIAGALLGIAILTTADLVLTEKIRAALEVFPSERH